MKTLLHALMLTGLVAPAFAHASQELKFKKLNVKVGHENIMAEIADDEPKREHGLMFRKELKDGDGMLFIFDESSRRSFWMKNTLVPLSIGYFDAQKVLIDIQDMQPASQIDKSPPVYPSKGPAQYALEVPLGWFKLHHVELKSKMVITRP
jgi:uncharacterized membrane protein (UPF0127 family)